MADSDDMYTKTMIDFAQGVKQYNSFLNDTGAPDILNLIDNTKTEIKTPEQAEIEKKRHYSVAKANDFIRKSRFELNKMERNLIDYICHFIKPTPIEDEVTGKYVLDYSFTIMEYCAECGIDYFSGTVYKEIKDALKRLSDNSMWFDIDDNLVLCRWLEKVRISKQSGKIQIRLDSDLVPYLFALHDHYTKYELCEVLAMRSSYSPRLFEILRSYESLHHVIIDLDILKKMLVVDDVKSYDRYPDFRRFVLEPAIKEINTYTYTTVDFEPIKKGNRVIKIKFHIAAKTYSQQLAVQSKVSEILDGDKQ